MAAADAAVLDAIEADLLMSGQVLIGGRLERIDTGSGSLKARQPRYWRPSASSATTEACTTLPFTPNTTPLAVSSTVTPVPGRSREVDSRDGAFPGQIDERGVADGLPSGANNAGIPKLWVPGGPPPPHQSVPISVRLSHSAVAETPPGKRPSPDDEGAALRLAATWRTAAASRCEIRPVDSHTFGELWTRAEQGPCRTC